MHVTFCYKGLATNLWALVTMINVKAGRDQIREYFYKSGFKMSPVWTLWVNSMSYDWPVIKSLAISTSEWIPLQLVFI